MKMNKTIFREYDIRGKTDIDYDEEFAYTLARATATHAQKYNAKFFTLGAIAGSHPTDTPKRSSQD